MLRQKLIQYNTQHIDQVKPKREGGASAHPLDPSLEPGGFSFREDQKNTEALVGKTVLSDNEDQMWSARDHLGGHHGMFTNVYTCVMLMWVLYIADEKCHVGDPRDK